MKKIVLLFACVFTFIACEKALENEYIIAGSAKGYQNGTKIIIQVQEDTELVAKDTVEVKNGEFEIKGSITSPEIGLLTIEGVDMGIPFILENGKISIAVDKDTIQNSIIGGTPENEIFQKYSADTKVVYKKIMDFQNANQEKYMTAQGNNDTVTMNSLTKQLEKIQDELNVLPKTIITKNPTNFFSALLVENLFSRQAITVEEAKAYYDKFNDKTKQSRIGKKLDKAITAASVLIIGKQAPDFSGPSAEGKVVSLKESLGKVTIIDFWASWCGPCRMENPSVVAMYNEYHSKGLNIIGVSLDKDDAKWKEAIAKDKLTWVHVSHLKFWDEPIAQQYNISSIPATFILDENGVIVGKDLRGDALKAKVKELLGL